jgi:hypothetical protein
MLQMHLCQSCRIALLFCVLQDTFSTTTGFDLARINYSTPWPPDESTIETFESSLSPKLYSFFIRSISRHALLRHPRRRQLLHPSDSWPQTKGCPRMRHLWVRRAAHNQTIPSLWWLCTSLFCLFILNINSMSSDVMQMTTNYCVSTSPCCR